MRLIDADALYQTEKLLGTNIVRRDKVASELLEQILYDIQHFPALRPVSREQVEKVWRGEWNQDEHGRVVCNRCGSIAAIGTENALHNAKKYDRFCFYCGAPMTDEAVDMVMERLEALK